MGETDVTMALSEALCDGRHMHLWKEIAKIASGENPRARYGGGGRVVEAGDVKPDPSGEGDLWLVIATVACQIDFEQGGDDLEECEVMFRVHGRSFPPQVEDLEIAQPA